MKYIVVDRRGYGYRLNQWKLKEPIVFFFHGDTYYGATIFDTRRQAQAAIKRTLRYAEKRGFNWNQFGYRIIPIGERGNK